MFIGHFALGLAAKRAAPRVPLAVLFLAAQLADILWPFFLWAGIEQVRVRADDNPLLRLEFVSYPYSHSLLLLAVWAVCLGVLYRIVSGDRDALLMVTALVLSHWLLDWIAHRPDMPVYPGGPTSGLGLWNSVVATLAVELTLFAIGISLCVGVRVRENMRLPRVWTLAAFLVIGYLASLMGPPPPSLTALYASTLTLFAVVLVWSWWAEKA